MQMTALKLVFLYAQSILVYMDKIPQIDVLIDAPMLHLVINNQDFAFKLVSSVFT